jgi:rhodanese-related sulfurtransferase/rubrerythrin
MASIGSYFLLVPAWSPDEARAFMRDNAASAYQLVDTRQPEEYAAGHLPGAVCIPLPQLQQRAAELSPEKPTLVYCASGIRSRAAAGILQRAGHEQAVALAGGLRAWEGPLSSRSFSPPHTVLACATNEEQRIALAWAMEDGSRRFYAALAGAIDEPYARWAFSQIEADESHHQRALEKLYRKMLHVNPPPGFPYALLPDWDVNLTESGLSLPEALARVEGHDSAAAAEIAMGMEADAQDMHLTMSRRTEDPYARAVYVQLAKQEFKHQEKMLQLFRTLSGET